MSRRPVVVLAQVQCHGQHGVVDDGGAADGLAALAGRFVATAVFLQDHASRAIRHMFRVRTGTSTIFHPIVMCNTFWRIAISRVGRVRSPLPRPVSRRLS